jgi:hypothetical protein
VLDRYAEAYEWFDRQPDDMGVFEFGEGDVSRAALM